MADGTHTITATAYDQYENVLGSSAVTVTVNNTHPVKLTAPANGATVSGSSVPVSITMTSSVWWASVHIDGQPWVTTPATQWDWNSTTVANGSHTITATAYGQNENVLGTSSATVNVSNSVTTSTPVAQASPASAPTPTAGGHAYYVDPSGNDSNAGTSTSSAWRTVARVNQANLQPGDVVYFKAGGVWREKLTPPSGGTSGDPITFAWYGSGAQPIISGSDVVSGWSSAGGSVYSAAVTHTPNNVYVDGSPGWGLSHACCSAGQSCGASGSCAIGPMKAGSWYYDSSAAKLFVWLSDSSSPSSHTVEAATRTAGIDVSADGNEKSYLVINGLEVQRTGGYGIHFYSGDANGQGLSGIVVRNCTVTQTGTGQIDDGSYYNGIHYSQAQELNTAPLYQNNTISWTGNHGNGINSQNADGAQLIGNHVSHFNHHGLDMKSSANDVVRDNVVHDSFGNGIYQETSANALIERNIIYNLSGAVAGKGSGIQIDVGSSSPRIYNNSIYNVLSGIYLTVAGTAKNNIVTNASLNPLEAGAGGTFDYNDWGPSPLLQENGVNYSFSQWQALGGHSHDMDVNPLWTNPASGNFLLQQGSPCLNAGTNVGLPYDGSAPDLGAVD